jgi:hypothetical protein
MGIQKKTSQNKKPDSKRKLKNKIRSNLTSIKLKACNYFVREQNNTYPNLNFIQCKRKCSPLWKKMSDEEKLPYVQLVKQNKETKLISKRNILRNSSSAWIFFTQHYEKELKQNNPSLSFGDCKPLCSKKWNLMTGDEKRPFVDLSNKDKEKYKINKNNLTKQQKKMLRKHKKMDKLKHANYPKSAIGQYAIYVKNNFERISNENPELNFQQIGKLQGVKWRNMTFDEKKPYIDEQNKHKKRYNLEYAIMKFAESLNETEWRTDECREHWNKLSHEEQLSFFKKN